MSNLDKAKAVIASDKKAAKAVKKKIDNEAKLQARAIREATKMIRADMKSYHNVETFNGKLTWHPRLMQLRLAGKCIMFIRVGWQTNVQTWWDNDFGGCYDDLVSLSATTSKYNYTPFIKANYTDSFLSSIANHMSKLL